LSLLVIVPARGSGRRASHWRSASITERKSLRGIDNPRSIVSVSVPARKIVEGLVGQRAQKVGYGSVASDRPQQAYSRRAPPSRTPGWARARDGADPVLDTTSWPQSSLISGHDGRAEARPMSAAGQGHTILIARLRKASRPCGAPRRSARYAQIGSTLTPTQSAGGRGLAQGLSSKRFALNRNLMPNAGDRWCPAVCLLADEVRECSGELVTGIGRSVRGLLWCGNRSKISHFGIDLVDDRLGVPFGADQPSQTRDVAESRADRWSARWECPPWTAVRNWSSFARHVLAVRTAALRHGWRHR